MADHEFIDDNATRYVFGELSPAERHEFESLLDQSSELRAQIRELRESTVALAAASRPAPLPQQVWRRIDEAVMEEQKQKPILSIFAGIWRNGWAAAAACLLGWIIYALSIDRPPRMQSNSMANSSGTSNATPAIAVLSPKSETIPAVPQLATVRTNQEAGNPEAVLRDQLVGLQGQIAQLLNSLAQQQAALNESSRLKFFQLTPDSSNGKPALSPALQRALFIAMARELGWLSPNDAPSPLPPHAPDGFSLSNRLNLDFVDLRPGADRRDPLRTQTSGSRKESDETSETAPTQNASTAVIPAFASNDSLILAIDTTVAPPGSLLTVFSGLPGQNVLGTATLGQDPLIITAPFSGGSFNGTLFNVTVVTPGGATNILYLAEPNP